ncbi:hypothetical protein [Ancylobacter polymorphus]|uniref:Uncharacterized protein n=1 Tax=Ancylobacter polymorphus TaxID=223390 RepID=A0A9E6ZU26_9HYPH|nr:hypothetical protein [Ancylobacter polymorphus]UOK71741.1 hypothetical protein K9D25_03160 [Ancylobacter polymorphus]
MTQDSELRFIKDAAFDEASKIVEGLLRSGDPAIFAAAEKNPDGSVNQVKLAQAMLRTTIRLAADIRSGKL